MARLALGVVGGVIGNIIAPGIGGTIGFALGSAAGAYLTQPDQPRIEGPRIDDGKVSSSEYGRMIPIIMGTVDVAGNVIDASALITKSHTESAGGGKGGGGQKVTSYTQFMDFDVLISEPAESIVRIYAQEQLIYDATPGSAVQRPEWLQFTFYNGSETQNPDPTFEAIRGAGNVPAYRGVCHIVFRQFSITEFGTTAINFRFVVTTNGADSVGEIEFNQGGSAFTQNIIHSLHTDLMVGSVQSELSGDGIQQMLVAFEPYGGTEAWRANINDENTYTAASWVMQCSFPDLTLDGVPAFAPNEFIAVYHKNNASSPSKRYLRFFKADSGVEYGFVQISDTTTQPKIVSCYEDAAIFYQLRSFGTGRVNRHSVTSTMLGSDVELSLPNGYDLYTAGINGIWVKPGSFIRLQTPVVLIAVVNQATSAIGFARWEEEVLGLGSTTWFPQYTTDELDPTDGAPVDGIYDKNEDCFWILCTDTTTNIARVEVDGTITSVTDWSAEFSITGAAVSIALDTSRDLLWVVLSGVAYAWPTYALTDTPIAHGAGIEGFANAWHPGSGTLWAGNDDTLEPSYWRYTLGNVSGGGETLESTVNRIIDHPGTNLTVADRDCSAGSGIVQDGFRLTRVGTRAAAINTLRTAFLFDLVPRAGVLTLVLRGGSSSATLNDDTLGAHISGSGNPPPRLEISRLHEQNLPTDVEVGFIDAEQNYEAGSERDQRLASAGGTVNRFEISVVLSHEDAAQLASILLHLFHIESERYVGSSMPSTRSAVVPAAIVTADVDDKSYPMWVESADIVEGGLIRFQGRRHEASIYNNFTVGGTTRDRLRQVEQLGLTQVIAADLPALRESEVNAGYYLGGFTYAPTWDGAVAYSSPDGIDYSEIGALTTQLTYGTLTAALPSGGETDMVNTLSVRLLSGELSSISDTVFLEQETPNTAAIGAPGRWLIVRFRDVAETDGVYSLTVLLQGLRDTKAAKGQTLPGDAFILLTPASLDRVTVASTQISTESYLKAVTIGRSIESSTARRFTPTGRSLQPYIPVNLSAEQAGSDWELSWDRQDRKPARFLQEPEMSEASESYQVEILNISGTAIRTQIVSTDEYDYTAADQTTDWGTTIEAGSYRVAQISAVVGVGPYENSTFGRASTDYDGLITGRGSLIEYWPSDEGSGTVLTSDSGSNNGTLVGGPVMGSTVLLLDGETSIQYSFADYADFTEFAALANARAIEFVVHVADYDASQIFNIAFHSSSTTPASGNGWYVQLKSNSKIDLVMHESNVVINTLSTTVNFLEGDTHIVAVNFGGTSGDPLEIYVDGVLNVSATLASAVTIPGATGRFRLGNMQGGFGDVNLSKISIYDAPLTSGDAYNSVIRGLGI